MKKSLALAAISLLLVACDGGKPPQSAATTAAPLTSPVQAADSIYRGGDIVTIDDDLPLAEAVAVNDGRIVAVGTAAEIEAAYRGESTRVVDLGGGALLPGFLDPHSHVSHALRIVDWANLSIPPVGPVDSIAKLLDVLRAHVREKKIPPGEWVVGYGYTKEGFPEQRHVTRDDLDPLFPDNPVMLLHVSSHGAVFNSRAFALAGIDAATPTPPGGVIVRKPGSNEPAGLVMETPFYMIARNLPTPTPEQMVDAMQRVQQMYASNGYTTIQDGATDPALLQFLEATAVQGALYLDLVALPIVASAEDFDKQAAHTFGRYDKRLKLGGIKYLTDGSPQGKTAWFTHPYLTGGLNGEEDWRGEPFIAPADYTAGVAELYRRGIQVWTHANGDAAADLVIAAHEAAGARAADDRRDVVIHSQFVRPDQLDAYARLGLGASFFTNHAFFWGDVHRVNLGDERTEFLSPLNAALERGIRFSNHTDFAVTPLDPFFTLWTATTRQSRSGAIVGPEQRVSTLQALKAITIDSAWLYHEDDSKGSITEGKLADFVVLDRNPLKLAHDDLRSLKVLATIKEDKLVFGSL